MRKKKFITILICIGSFIAINFAVQLIRNLSVSFITGYDFNTPEYEIAYQFNMQNNPDTTFQYINDDGIIFAISTDSNGKSQSLAIWKDDDGKYTRWSDDYISIGVSLYALGFNGSDQAPRLFLTGNGKYVFDFLIEGYPYSKNEDPKNVINLNNAYLYDNNGNKLSQIDAENAIYYYSVMDDISSDYKVYLHTEDNEYLLLDSTKKYLINDNI